MKSASLLRSDGHVRGTPALGKAILRLVRLLLGIADRAKQETDAAVRGMHYAAMKHHMVVRQVIGQKTPPGDFDVLAALAHEMHNDEQRRIAESRE